MAAPFIVALLALSPVSQAGPPAEETGAPPALLAAAAPEDGADVAEAPFAGSTLSLRNVFSATSLARGHEPTYNPYDVLALSVRPTLQLAEGYRVSAALELASELTQADWTRDRFYLSDTTVTFSASELAKLPVLEVGVAAALALTLPTSPASRNESLLLGAELAAELSRHVALLGGLEVAYDLGLAKSLHRYTTSGDVAVLQGACSLGLDARCATSTSGSCERNVSWAVSNGLSAALAATDWLTASAAAQLVYARLYPLFALSPAARERLSGGVVDPVSARYYTLTQLGVTLFPGELLSGSLAISSLHHQLAADGTRRAPFINRFTRISLALTLDLEQGLGLVAPPQAAQGLTP